MADQEPCHVTSPSPSWCALGCIALVEETMRRKKVSRAELARRLDVSRARVTMMFTTDRNWSLATLGDVFDALEVRMVAGIEDDD